MGKVRIIIAAALLAGTSPVALLAVPGAHGVLVSPAAAQSALVLENLAIDFPMMTYRIPRMEVVGTGLSRSEFLALFDRASNEPWAQRFARLDAAEIRIPELVTEQKHGADKQTIVYRDVRLTDVKAGRIGRMSTAGGSLEAALRDSSRMSGRFGPMGIVGLDLQQTARVYTEKATAPAEPLRPLYESFTMSGFGMDMPDGGSFQIEGMKGGRFAARPTSESWLGALAMAEKLDQSGGASQGDKSKTLKAMAEFLSAFSLGRIEIDGVSFAAPKDAEEARGRIRQIVLSGETAPGQSEMSLRELEVTAKSGSARIGLLSVTGFSFEPTLQGLATLADTPLADLEPEDFRKLVPTIGTVRVEGVDFDVPDTERPRGRGPKPENIRFTVKTFEATADKPVNGVPTNLRFAIENIAFPVPAGSRDETLRTLRQLGYDSVDLSTAVHASWNEPGSELLLREVSIAGADMGSLAIRGTLGNITRDVFEGDSAVAMVALLGATAKTVHLSLQDNGLANRFLSAEAKKRRRSAEDLRKEYGAMAAFGLPAMLGNSEAAKTITAAVARFIAKPGRLEMSARARNGGGLGVADVMATGGAPAAILEQIEVTATAQ